MQSVKSIQLMGVLAWVCLQTAICKRSCLPFLFTVASAGSETFRAGLV